MIRKTVGKIQQLLVQGKDGEKWLHGVEEWLRNVEEWLSNVKKRPRDVDVRLRNLDKQQGG
jgi:hypothetical protein